MLTKLTYYPLTRKPEDALKMQQDMRVSIVIMILKYLMNIFVIYKHVSRMKGLNLKEAGDDELIESNGEILYK